jgi:hypothetical protein
MVGLATSEAPVVRAAPFYNKGTRYLPTVDQAVNVVLDNALLEIGTDQDGVIVLSSASLGNDEELTGVIEGTSDTIAVAANSLLISNITNDGDIAIYVSKAGNTHTAFLADGSTGDTILNAASGASVDIYIAGAKEIDYATGAMAFQQTTTISAAGHLTLHAASGSDVLIGEVGNTILYVDGGHGTLGIGGAAISGPLLATRANITSQTAVNFGAFTITGVAGSDVSTLRMGMNVQEATSGTHPVVAALHLLAPTVTNGGGSEAVTSLATLYITGAPTAGTAPANGPYAIFVAAGSIRLNGSLWVESTPTEGASGEQLTSGGTGAVMTWAADSSLGRFKNTLGELSSIHALSKIMSWRPKMFTYRPDAEMSTHDIDTVYVGVYGEDAPEVMHHEGKIFSPISAFGYTVGAIQALYDEINSLKAKVLPLVDGG